MSWLSRLFGKGGDGGISQDTAKKSVQKGGPTPNVEQLEGKRDVQGLIKALGYQKRDDVRKAAALTLGEMGNGRAVGPLITALKDDSFYVRWAAAKALGEMDDTRAVEPLIATLKDDWLGVRRAAADALMKLGGPEAEGALAEYQASMRAQDRHRAEHKEKVEALIRALSAESAQERVAAAEALGELGDSKAIGPLAHALLDPFRKVERIQDGLYDSHHVELWPVSDAARNALKRIGGPEAERVLANHRVKQEH